MLGGLASPHTLTPAILALAGQLYDHRCVGRTNRRCLECLDF